MVLSWLCFYDALLAVALVAAGIVAPHYGMTPPFTGFQIFLVGFFFSLLAIVFGLIALFLTRTPERRPGRPRAILGTVLALMVAAPVIMIVMRHAAVPINDITTDTENPPQFAAALQVPQNRGRDMAYNRKFAAVQASAYPEVAPLKMEGAPDDAYKRVEVLAGEIPDWQITRNDPKARQLEGIATSGLFKFKDDFVIEIRPGGNGKSLVEMRSKSRDGISDLGANRDRIKSFFRVLEKGPHVAPPGSAQVQP